MKKTIQEFKKFALKGNVIDLAVGVIIGGAFGKIVSSLVNDLVMPMLGMLTGKVNLTKMKYVVKPAVDDSAELAIRYGSFLQTVVDFLIIGVTVFLAVRFINHLRRKEAEKPAAPPAPPRQEVLLEEIRDLLKERNDR